MKTLLVFLLLFACLHCGGADSSVGGLYEDGSPIAKVKVDPEPDAGMVDASPLPTPDSSVPDALGDTAPDACFADTVSYPSNVVCGPQGPGAVCQVTGTIYVCREPPGGPGQPPLTDCVLVSRGVDKNTAELVTRTLCPKAAWVPVPDTGNLCIPSMPHLFNGPSAGPILAGCFRVGGWMIDGISGVSVCCS